MQAVRYIRVPGDQFKKGQGFATANIVADNDFLVVTNIINCAELHTFENGDKLLSILLTSEDIKDIQEITEVANPLGAEALDIMDIWGSFVGVTLKDVLVAYPELDTTKTIEDVQEDGTILTREIPLLQDIKWA